MPDDPNTALMQRIKTQWGVQIAAACATSSVPPAFVAALIANESGGDLNAKRFEPAVFANLAAVVLSKKAAYEPRGSRRALGIADLLDFIVPASPASYSTAITGAVQRLYDLSTSFGLTQIMGWHLIEMGSALTPATLAADWRSQLGLTLELLAWFADNYDLDLQIPGDSDATTFFHCWNTGDPEAPTFDPNYAANGLARMAAYAALP